MALKKLQIIKQAILPSGSSGRVSSLRRVSSVRPGTVVQDETGQQFEVAVVDRPESGLVEVADGVFACPHHCYDEGAVLQSELAGVPRRGTLSDEVMLSKQGMHAASQLLDSAKLELAMGDNDMFGIKSDAIAAGATGNAIAYPQRHCVPVRLSIDATQAPFWEIVEVKAGADSLLSSADPIPAAMWTPDATVADFRSINVSPGMQFLVRVTNLSTEERVFRAACSAVHMPLALQAAQLIINGRVDPRKLLNG